MIKRIPEDVNRNDILSVSEPFADIRFIDVSYLVIALGRTRLNMDAIHVQLISGIRGYSDVSIIRLSFEGRTKQDQLGLFIIFLMPSFSPEPFASEHVIKPPFYNLYLSDIQSCVVPPIHRVCYC